MADTSVIIVAGGSSTRMGRPKQLLLINGKAVLVRSIEAFTKVRGVKEVIVVTTAEIFAKVSKKFKGLKHAVPGATRLESVKNGLALVSADAKLIAVHDGARPLVNPKDIEACLKAAAQNKAAVLAVPIKDTVKEVKNGKVIKTPNRAGLYSAQTPQCYAAATLKLALKKYGRLKNATDESQLAEKLGVKVAIVASSYSNIKITTPEDLIIAEALCRKEKQKK